MSLSVVRNPAVYSALEHLDVLPVVPQRVLLSQYCQPIVDLSAFLLSEKMFTEAIEQDMVAGDDYQILACPSGKRIRVAQICLVFEGAGEFGIYGKLGASDTYLTGFLVTIPPRQGISQAG